MTANAVNFASRSGVRHQPIVNEITNVVISAFVIFLFGKRIHPILFYIA